MTTQAPRPLVPCCRLNARSSRAGHPVRADTEWVVDRVPIHRRRRRDDRVGAAAGAEHRDGVGVAGHPTDVRGVCHVLSLRGVRQAGNRHVESQSRHPPARRAGRRTIGGDGPRGHRSRVCDGHVRGRPDDLDVRRDLSRSCTGSDPRVVGRVADAPRRRRPRWRHRWPDRVVATRRGGLGDVGVDHRRPVRTDAGG